MIQKDSERAAGWAVLTTMALVAAALVVVLPSPAQAHTADTYFHGRWPSNTNIAWARNAGFPAGEQFSRVLNATSVWNAAGTEPGIPDFAQTLANGVSYGNAQVPCSLGGVNRGVVFWNDLDYIPGVLAATRMCGVVPFPGGSTLHTHFTIEFDNETNWYTGSSGTVPSGQWDLYSIAAHELGHAIGFTGGTGGHFPESDAACPESSSRNTMCLGHSSVLGTSYLRTLGTHDIHTLDAAY